MARANFGEAIVEAITAAVHERVQLEVKRALEVAHTDVEKAVLAEVDRIALSVSQHYSFYESEDMLRIEVKKPEPTHD